MENLYGSLIFRDNEVCLYLWNKSIILVMLFHYDNS